MAMTKAKTTKKSTAKSRQPQSRLKKVVVATKRRVAGLLARRPHRSFRRTKRRDYVRSLRLPGFWAFTGIVWKTLWKHKRTFGLLAIVYALLTIVLVGIASQDTYDQLRAVLEDTGGDIFSGNWGEIGKASMLLWAGVTGSLTNTASESQQIYGAILLLFAWLTTVWLLRAILAGRQPRLRDGLYSAGAPVLAMFLVGLVMIVQLLPLALAIIGYSAATTSGFLSGGVEAMLFWVVAGLLAILSLYWATSTFIALVVVTLPGMYPMQALRTAGDLVIGRRIRILLRLLWMLALLAVVWILIVVPMILFDTWIKTLLPAIAWLPIVPVVLLVMSTLSVIWSGSYVYMLYRRIVDDDASPA
jgi:hypothetical protein